MMELCEHSNVRKARCSRSPSASRGYIISRKGAKTLTIPDTIKQKGGKYREDREITEKALHRLLLIGVVSDYTQIRE